MVRRNVAHFIGIVGIAAVVATIAQAPNAHAGVLHPRDVPVVVNDSEEIALGAALIKQFDSDRGVDASKSSRAIEAYLQRVADSLGRHTKRKLPWVIHYDSHPAIKSGFALPGGHIVIWGGALAYMSKEDEVAAIIAHEMAHTEEGQVNRRIDSLVAKTQRSVANPAQWNWREFGATYGETLEKVCDYEGAKLMVKAGYSPLGLKMLLQSFIALGTVHAPTTPPSRVIGDRVDQIDKEIVTEHWEALTALKPLRIP